MGNGMLTAPLPVSCLSPTISSCIVTPKFMTSRCSLISAPPLLWQKQGNVVTQAHRGWA